MWRSGSAPMARSKPESRAREQGKSGADGWLWAPAVRDLKSPSIGGRLGMCLRRAIRLQGHSPSTATRHSPRGDRHVASKAISLEPKRLRPSIVGDDRVLQAGLAFYFPTNSPNRPRKRILLLEPDRVRVEPGSIWMQREAPPEGQRHHRGPNQQIYRIRHTHAKAEQPIRLTDRVRRVIVTTRAALHHTLPTKHKRWGHAHKQLNSPSPHSAAARSVTFGTDAAIAYGSYPVAWVLMDGDTDSCPAL